MMGGWHLATKSEDVGLSVRAIRRFPSDHNPPTSQTDGRTDDLHAIAIASRGEQKNIADNIGIVDLKKN